VSRLQNQAQGPQREGEAESQLSEVFPFVFYEYLKIENGLLLGYDIFQGCRTDVFPANRITMRCYSKVVIVVCLQTKSQDGFSRQMNGGLLMDKQMLIRDMKQFIGGGGFINVSQITKYLKRSRDCVSTLVEGLDYLVTGREKKYFILDITSRIMEYRNVRF